MKEELVSFKTAKLAKEKGFNEVLHISDTSYFYYDDFLSTGSNTLATYRYNERPDISLAPNQSLLAKWLRDVKLISVTISHASFENYYFNIHTRMDKEGKNYLCWRDRTPSICDMNYSTYEEALEAGLSNALLLI